MKLTKRAKNIEFKCHAPQASRVAVAGEFNDWNPAETPMHRNEHDGWAVKIPLPAGRHEYRFVVDGEWVSDPNARESVPNPFGTANSVITV